MRLIDADALIDIFIEQQKMKWNQCSSPSSWSDAYDNFIDALQMSETVGEWISVDDRLPDKCNNYLVCFGKSIGIRMKTAFWLPEKRIWKGAEAYSTLNGITHWMQLPEPPKEVTQE